MGFFRKQLLKIIEWEDTTQNTIAYKYPMPPKAEIMNGSQLIVREGQVAVLVDGGKLADVYPAGRHKLETGNMPILTQLRGWKYGFASPFVCDVVYVNVKLFAGIKWGTTTPVMMRDSEFGMVQIGAYGQFDFRVKDPAVFLRELMGSGLSYETDAIVSRLKNTVVSGVSESIAASKVAALDLAASYSVLEAGARDALCPQFGGMGFELVSLDIVNISLPESLRDAMSKRTRMNIIGDAGEYTRYAAADAMQEMARHGGGGSAAGLGLGVGAGAAMAGLYASAVSPAAQPVGGSAAKKVCPTCGTACAVNARFCPQCGTKLGAPATCPKCGNPITGGAKFCPTCGTPLEKHCPKCGKAVKDELYCPACGEKLG